MAARDGVTLRVLGVARVKRELRRMRRRARDLRPPFRAFSDVLRLHNEAVFQTEGAFAGKRWAPLTPAYAAWKFRAVGALPILQLEGDLKRSLTNKPMDIERVNKLRAEFGTRDRKAVWHQFGTRHMPARPPVTVTKPLIHELERLVADHIVDDRFADV